MKTIATDPRKSGTSATSTTLRGRPSGARPQRFTRTCASGIHREYPRLTLVGGHCNPPRPTVADAVAHAGSDAVPDAGPGDISESTASDPKHDIEACYAAHAPIVMRYVSRICGKEHSFDVTQDVFAAFWNSPTAFDPDRGSIQSLLLTIAHRRAIDVARQNTSRTWRDHRYASVTSDAISAVDSDMLRFELADEVKRALEKLRPELQQPIRMAYFDGCTYQQVAVRLNLPEGTVKSRIRTGFAQLRILLEQYSPQPVSA